MLLGPAWKLDDGYFFLHQTVREALKSVLKQGTKCLFSALYVPTLKLTNGSGQNKYYSPFTKGCNYFFSLKNNALVLV